MNKSIEQTITLLSKDSCHSNHRRNSMITIAVMIPSCLALTFIVSILTEMPFRVNYTTVIQQPFVMAKQIIPFAVFLSLLPILSVLFRPEGKLRHLFLWPILAAATISILIAMELWQNPTHHWTTLIMGKTAQQCLVGISLISVSLLIGNLQILRQGAITRPRQAGFLAGIAAGTIGAFLYAFVCMEDSPLFYGTWYSLAILGMGGLGAMVGKRALSW